MNLLKSIGRCAAATVIAAGALTAGEKTVLHCFTFTPIEAASQSDWDAFYKATDALPGKIPGLKRVWYGKLNAPLVVPRVNMDAEARKKFSAGEAVTGEATALRRVHGACMEFDSIDAYKTYGSHAEHKTWEGVYGKVRQPGTTTFQIIGQ